MKAVTALLFLLLAALPYAVMLGRPEAAPPPASAAAADTLEIHSPHRREVRLEYTRGFQEWMRREHGRAVDIRWIDVGGTSKVLKDLESRFATSPDAPGVDLFFGGGIAPFLQAADQGWLERVDLPEPLLAAIPAACAGSPVVDPGRRWFGVALSGFGILYNRPVVERLRLPVPEDWEALARPEYFTWVGSGDPRSSGSVHMCYEIILQAYGFERGWSTITRLCANVRTFGEGGGTAPREVAAGEVAAGMVIDQYAQTVIDAVGADQLVLVLPRRTTVINADPIGLIRGSARPELSRRFIEYVLSDEGQRLLFQPAGENGQKSALHRMPVRPALYTDPHAPRSNPYDFPAGLDYDNDKATRRWNTLNDLMGIWLIDAHRDLQAAWKTVIAAGVPEDAVARLCAPPVTEAELDALGDAWKDPRRKLEVTQAWARAAQRRYRRVADE
jgi:ABC-type Fe3+ transport system substrate-binding protein